MDEIRADLLHEYQVDLAVWWRARRWKALLGLVDQLPEASRFRESLLNDPDFAEAYVAQEGQDDGAAPEWAPRVSEFDLHATLLRDVIQAIYQLTAITVGVNTGKSPKIPPYPMPQTAIDGARRKQLQEWASDLISKLTPHAAQ